MSVQTLKQMLTTALIALQAVQALQIASKVEAEVQEMQHSWPADNCCRIYANMSYDIGHEADWEDFCTEHETEDTVIDLSTAILPSGEDWDNEAKSYKCGRKTAIKFCRLPNEERCDEYEYSESAAGGSESQDIGIHGKHTVIRLTPYDPDVRIAATVYSMTECHGHSSVIWIDEGKIGTGETYHNIHETLVTTPGHTDIGIASVMFPQGTGYFLDTFEHTNFRGFSQRASGGRDDWNDCENLHNDEWSNWYNGRKHRRASSLYFGKGEDWHPGADASTIEDHCCRLYTRPDFDMSWIHDGDQFFHDVCMSESDIDTGSNTVFNFNEIQWLTTSMQSWRCGALVHSSFTNSADAAVESTASGGAENSLVDLDVNTILELSAYADNEWRPQGDYITVYPATVFSGENCSGDSSEIVLDLDEDGISTGKKYKKVKDSLTVGQNIQSVYLPADSELELTVHPKRGDLSRQEWIAAYFTVESDVTTAQGEATTCFEIEGIAKDNVKSLYLKDLSEVNI